MTLGQRISRYRKELGLSQEELGGRLGVSRQAVSKWETGAATPDMENLLALAREFGVSITELADTPERPAVPAEEVPYRQVSSRRWLWAVISFGLLLAAMVGWLIAYSVQLDRRQISSRAMPATEFILERWTTDHGRQWVDWLALGEQDGPFPFGTGLEADGPETVTASPYPDLEYHDVSCGDLTLRYRLAADGSSLPSIMLLETDSREYQTPRGIGVGSTEEDVLRNYGDTGELIYCLPGISPDTAIHHDDFYVYCPADPEADPLGFGCNLIFLMAGGHVVGIRMEDASYPYYHANHRDSFPVVNGAPDFSQRVEQPPKTEQRIYDALQALVLQTDLTAEELYNHRWTIFSGLSDLDWWAFGNLGTTEYPEDTINTLLQWLRGQAPYSPAETFCLQMGCASHLDGWLTESYASVLSGAFFADPVTFVQSLATEGAPEEVMSTAIQLTAYDAVWYSQKLTPAVEALEAALMENAFTEKEAGWCRLLLLYLSQSQDDPDFSTLPSTPSELP